MNMLACRTCLSRDDLRELFGEHGAESFNKEQLILVTGLTMEPNDGLPQSACKSCIKFIYRALDFRELSTKVDQLLRNEITKNITVKTEDNADINDFDNKINSILHVDIIDNESDSLYKDIDGYIPEDCMELSDSDSHSDDSTSLAMYRDIIVKRNSVENNWKDKDVLYKTGNKDKLKISKNANKNDKDCPKTNIKKRDYVDTHDNNKLVEDYKTSSPKVKKKRKQFKRKQNRLSNKKLTIDDLESSNSELETNNVRIEDFESDSSITDYQLSDRMSEKIGNKDLIKDKHSSFIKNVTEEKKNFWSRRDELKKLYEKCMALAVTPYPPSGPVQCRVCHSVVKSAQNFKVHAKTHFEPEFSCEGCGKKFRSRNHMSYHQQRMHGGEKRLACERCAFRAVDRPTLRNHERAVHTGERPYECAECGRAFRMRNNIVQHMRKHFGVRNLQCERCPAMFRSRSELWGHQTKVHFLTYTYPCYLCAETYKGPAPVKKHLLNVHGVPVDQQLKVKCIKTRKGDNISTSESSAVQQKSDSCAR